MDDITGDEQQLGELVLGAVPSTIKALVLLTSPEVLIDDPLVLLQQMPDNRHSRRAAVGLLAESVAVRIW